MSGYEIARKDQSCPSCERPMALDAVICTQCGMNLTTGKRLSEHSPTAPTAPSTLNKPQAGLACPRCGYDLRGLGGKPCPGCGQTPEGRRKGGIGGFREERRQEEIVGYWKKTWMIAGIGLVAGAALTAGVGMWMVHWSPMTCLIHLAVCIAAMILSSLALGFFFIGFEEDLRGLCLRSLGIGSLWAGLWIVGLLVPHVPYYGELFLGMVHASIAVVLVRVFTDRDWDDSCWIGGGAWVLRFVPWVAVTQILNQ